jgi:hypothetical protein
MQDHGERVGRGTKGRGAVGIVTAGNRVQPCVRWETLVSANHRWHEGTRPFPEAWWMLLDPRVKGSCCVQGRSELCPATCSPHESRRHAGGGRVHKHGMAPCKGLRRTCCAVLLEVRSRRGRACRRPGYPVGGTGERGCQGGRGTPLDSTGPALGEGGAASHPPRTSSSQSLRPARRPLSARRAASEVS